MNIESTLGFIFLQNANIYRNALEKAMNKFGLHYAQISILDLLWERNGLSQKRLAERLQLSQPTINKMVKSLAQSGFIVSRQCEKDGRKVRVYLTDKGREIEDDVLNAAKLIESDIFSPLTETEKLILKQILERLREKRS